MARRLTNLLSGAVDKVMGANFITMVENYAVDKTRVSTVSLHRNDLFSATIRITALHYGVFQQVLLPFAA